MKTSGRQVRGIRPPTNGHFMLKYKVIRQYERLFLWLVKRHSGSAAQRQ